MTKNYVEMKQSGFSLRLSAVTGNIIRCTYSMEDIKEADSLIVEKSAFLPVEYEKEETDEHLMIKTQGLTADADKNGSVTWRKPDGSVLLKEDRKEFIKIPVEIYTTCGEAPIVDRVKTVDGERNFIKNLKSVVDHEAYQGRLYFDFADDEGIYGLGQGEDGVYDYRHHTQYLYQHNMRIPMPMFVSSRGYGILFDCCSLMTFNDTEVGSYMFFDTIDQLDYYVVSGSMDEIMAGFRQLTGDAAMLPKWAYGYVQSKEQYYTAAELADIAAKYREIGVPLDCVVQDWNSWPEGQWGQKSLHEERYADIEEQMKRIHDMNVHTMISVWPNMNSGTPNYDEFMEAGYMLNDLATYDAFNEKAREMYWKQAKEGLFDKGFDSFWCDSTEPFSGPDWNGEIKREAWKRYDLVGTEHKKYLPAEKANAYALMHAKGIYENQRKTTTDKRVLNLTRSGYAGGQKYAAMLWSGDIYASWDTMRRQIAEGLNMGMSGYPYWTLDIGGFFTVWKEWKRRGCSCSGDPTPKWFWRGHYEMGVEDMGFRELYTRWIQLGVFLPMFRSHGTDTPREIWNFGEPGSMFYDSIEKFIKLRYRLMPYIYSMAGAVVQDRYTIMRSLLFDFASDPKSAHMDTEYMFGNGLLVCPVLEPMYYESESRPVESDKTAEVYLPQGTDWYDFWNGTPYEGGRSIRVEAAIDSMPLFVRAGSIIPMANGLQYAAQKSEGALELHVYTGADGTFTMYDDAGDDFSYEKGEFARTKISWNNRERKLVLSAREGSYKGMPAEQEYAVFVNEIPVTEIKYDGKEMILSL